MQRLTSLLRSRSPSVRAFERRGAGRRVRHPRARPRPCARPRSSRTATCRTGCTPQQRLRLLDRPEVIQALGERPSRTSTRQRARSRARVPTPARARARRRRAASGDVPRREAVRLEDDDVVVDCGPAARRRRPPAARAPRASRARRPRSARSGRPTRAAPARSSRSRRTTRARARRCRARARRPSFAPTAHTSAPGRSHSPRRTGSRERVTVTTTSCSRRVAVALAGSAPYRSQNARRCARYGSRRRRARSTARAARMHATCDSACQPQPITPSDVAPARARCFAATAARGTGAQLPELVGVDHRDELRPSAREERDDERRARREARVRPSRPRSPSSRSAAAIRRAAARRGRAGGAAGSRRRRAPCRWKQASIAATRLPATAARRRRSS